jgi:hypothetical protein
VYGSSSRKRPQKAVPNILSYARPHILTSEVEGVGFGSTDGSAMKVVKDKREKLQAAVLKKALEDYPKQVDKLCTAFLMALPGPHSPHHSSERLCVFFSACPPSVAGTEWGSTWETGGSTRTGSRF